MKTGLSINSDFKNDRGYPFGVFRQIADAGFTHIHWGHHWNADFIYTAPEIAEIKKQLDFFSLSLSDLHASGGIEKCWYSPLEYERIAGVELVKNRIYMAALLGGDAVVLHPFVVYEKEAIEKYREQGLKSLEELESFARSCGIRIALENLFQADGSGIKDASLVNLDTIEFYFGKFPSDFLGFCWDIGHCIILGDEAFRRCAGFAGERLAVMHLNDNRGDMDQHSAPFTWSRRWEWIAETIADSPYPDGKPVLLEVDVNRNPPASVVGFLRINYEAGTRIKGMIEERRSR